MSSLSREEGRLLIGRIREESGGISPEDRAVSRPAVLRALESVRRKVGSTTKILAMNLHSKDTRFLYELIQNAEDNQYSAAGKAGDELYLRFNMYPDRIVLESNEDGFSESNVEAICSTGKSTKTTSEGYIGQKGIGFKSVFKVAKKVNIQSGPFSFSFEHVKDSLDDGLGMVTPMDEEFVELPEGVRTRITLILSDSLTFEQGVEELANIPNTLLLFFSKLEALYINIFPPNSNAITTKTTRSSNGKHLETITKTRTVNNIATEEKCKFYVMKRTVKDLPYDEARLHTDQAQVVLAFPVDNDDIPIVEHQHVFALLPLRQVGFTFLIQSYLITQASREDLPPSIRNKALLSTVAETFRDAVLYFCTHPTLQYTWVRYLPANSISDEFWKDLKPKIRFLLEITPCVRSWSGKSLHLSRMLYRVPSMCKDKDSEPLFADLDPECYLSPFYTKSDSKCLESIGSGPMGYRLFVSIVRADLERKNSKMKRVDDIDEDWHSQVASTLCSAIETGNEGLMERITNINLIPLQDGTWVSMRSSPIYLPPTGNSAIPPDLNLNMVHLVAASNSSRSKLFQSLGVQVASVHTVVSRITAKYMTLPRENVTCAANISHLRYIYTIHPRGTTEIDTIIFLYDQYLNVKARNIECAQHIYFMDVEDQFGAWNLLRSIYFDHSSFTFLNKSYLDSVSSEKILKGRTWKEWLGKFAGVHRYPQLTKLRTTDVLSDEFKFIMANRPEKLVGLLMHNWSTYETQMTPALLTELKLCKVPSDGNLAADLGRTFLPRPMLKSLVSEFRIRDFPFLILPEGITNDNNDKWEFLMRFGVKGFPPHSDGLQFYTQALWRLALENANSYTPELIVALFQIYGGIERNCSTSADFAYVSEIFKTHERIYVSKRAEWTTSECCVWNAPSWLQSKTRLEGITGYSKHQHLFKVVLKIRDADWNDYLADLKILKSQQNPDIGRVLAVYEHLWREFEPKSGEQVLCKIFEEQALIFVPLTKSWHPPSCCIWADDEFQMPEKVSLQPHYDHLIDFFCKSLSVSKPNLRMYIEALKNMSERTLLPPIPSQFKKMIRLISSMDPTSTDVTPLKTACIFSVVTTTGTLMCSGMTSEWVIIDRLEYGVAFAGQMDLLDYTLEEVRLSTQFLFAMDLGSRYLSKLVEEQTTVNDSFVDKMLSVAFRKKARALSRCAVHFNSQKYKDEDLYLYFQLFNAHVHVSDEIFKSISVVQSEKTTTIKNCPANLHLKEHDGELHLYVPRDEEAREECFFGQLPRALMKFLGISNPVAEALLVAIIGCRSLLSVEGILKGAGIVEVDWLPRTSPAVYTTGEESSPYELIDAISRTTLNPSTPEQNKEQNQMPIKEVESSGEQATIHPTERT